MEDFNDYNRHYIRIDASDCIIDGFSDAFRQPQDGDICINEQGGYQFRLFPGGEENPLLFDGMSDIPLYKYVGGKVIARAEQELNADREAARAEQERLANLPTRLDRVEAQVSYIAMMTDMLLPDDDKEG